MGLVQNLPSLHLVLLQQDWPGAGYAAETQEGHMAEGKKSLQNRCSYWQLQST